MVNPVRYWTSHPQKSPQYWRDWFCLSDDYVFELDERDPDYLLVTEHIYSDPSQFRRYWKLRSDKRISIFIAGEAISPDLNLFDYAFCYDRGLACGDRIVRKPPVLFFKQHVFSPLTKGCENAESELGKKTGFCNFIYSNPKAHPRRDQLFNLLSGYKRVDSLGPHLNNCGNRSSREDGNWRELLVSMKRPYKFSIAAENASFAGYTTEKLISSFQANTVPIYWGNPLVTEEFNSESLINANGMSDAELLEIVRKVDEDDSLWCKMVSAPAITEQQDKRLTEESTMFSDFAARLFDGRPLADKKRAPAGYWGDIYQHAIGRCGVFRLLSGALR